MPILAMNRDKSIITALLCNAITTVAAAYHKSEIVKIARRP